MNNNIEKKLTMNYPNILKFYLNFYLLLKILNYK